uniref:Prominin 1 b n=1 Tax=Esox lucius TaxID=8010 RepID=A0A3P8ZF23_ESOLU
MWKTGLLVLFWGLLSSGELQQQTTEPEHQNRSPSGKLDFGNVPQGVYETVPYYEPGMIGILFHMVHAFLHVVQPNPFPEDLVVEVAKDKFGAIQSEYQKAIYYEIGFVVCAVLGLLFAVLMPAVGLFFCLCRCCNNCGGEMHQRQRKNADCQRGLLTTLLFTTSLIITAGVLCSYAANQNLSSQFKSVRRLISSNLRDLHTFSNETPMQIDYLIVQYATAKNKVISDLDNVGPLLGGKIHHELGKEVRPALDGALNMAGAMRETKEALENASVSLEVLQEATGKLHFNLSLVRSGLNRSLNDPGCSDEESDATSAQLCRSIRSSLIKYFLSACHVLQLPNVYNQLESVNQVLKTDLRNIVQRGYASFNDTPGMVNDQMRNVIDGARSMLDTIGTNISSFTKVFPVHSSLTNFTNFISHTQSKIEDLYPEIDEMDFYRWVSCIGLCSMVVLILAFNFLAILCGNLGYDKHASPTTRGCVSNTGGTLLMAGVGFSFLFSWILMGVVTAMFLVGGNMEKLVCEPFHTKQLFKVLDTPHLVNPDWRNFIPGYLYNDSDLDLTVESFYSNCKDNQGIYSAMRLDKLLNVSAFLNSSLVSKVGKMFENVNIDLRGIVLLEPDGKQNLMDFSETGVAEINYAAYLEEVNKGVTQVDLLSYANELEAQTDLMPKGPLQTSLKGQANSLRQIHSQQVIPMEQSLMCWQPSKQPSTSSLRMQRKSSTRLIWLPNHCLHFNETQKYKQTIVGYFRQYIEWVRSSLAMEVAACKPFSNIVDTVEIIACSVLVDSLNTFWFGLGCCALFLLPSIILSVKLAKFYRRMDTEDVYDDIETIPMKTIPAYDTLTRFPRASAPPRHIDW